MRSYILTFMCSLCCLVTFNCDQKNTGPDYTYVAVKSKQGINIDGILDETIWSKVETVTLRNNKTGKQVRDSTIMTWAACCYDRQNFYIAFECNDPDIWSTYTERDQQLWKQEVVEVFIDTDNDPATYIEIEVSPSNVLFDSYIVKPADIDIDQTAQFNLSGIMTAVHIQGTLNNKTDRDKKWTVEIAVPFKDMIENSEKVNFKNMQWKINYYRINQDRNDQPGWYAWSPTGSHFHVPSKFGLLKFDK